MNDQTIASIADNWRQRLETKAPFQISGAKPDTPGQLFCANWQKAKELLQEIAPFLPQPGPILAVIVIAAGDAVFDNVCTITAKP